MDSTSEFTYFAFNIEPFFKFFKNLNVNKNVTNYVKFIILYFNLGLVINQ